MAEAVARAGGGRRVRIRRLPWFLLRLIGPFDATLRETLHGLKVATGATGG